MTLPLLNKLSDLDFGEDAPTSDTPEKKIVHVLLSMMSTTVTSFFFSIVVFIQVESSMVWFFHLIKYS